MEFSTNELAEHQVLLEKLYDKNQVNKRVRQEFIDCEVDFPGWFQAAGVDEDFGYSLLVQMALHKRAKVEVLVGVLRYHFDDGQKTMDEIAKCLAADLIQWDPIVRVFIVNFTVTPEVQAELDRYQFPLPMVVEPKEITNNKQNGYLCSTGSVILKNNHHDEDVALDHLNRVNKIKFSINWDTASMVKNQWRNLDKPKDGESKDDFKKRVKAFEKFNKNAHEVMALLTRYGNEFYFTHRLDKRGRIYCAGYACNYQGNPWQKSILELANKELVE